MSKRNKPKTMNDIREMYGLPRIENNFKYDDYWKRVQKKEKEIERLNNELEVSRTNEETYRLEMKDITKRLGFDEDTLFDEVKDKAERLNNIINELEKYLEQEKDRLARETSNIYENSLGEPRLVNEDIFNEIIIIQDKIKALKGDSSNDKSNN